MYSIQNREYRLGEVLTPMSWIADITQIDANLSSRLRLRPDLRGAWQIASFFAHSGDSWFWMIGLGLVWLLGDSVWHLHSALLAIAIVIQAVTVLAIKFTIKRRRPEGEWGAIYRNTDPHSFPSGHAARAFMLAVMALVLGPVWFGWIVLLWAPVVSLARVAMGVHYLSDVIAGMVVGILIGLLMLQIQPVFLAMAPFLFYR